MEFFAIIIIYLILIKIVMILKEKRHSKNLYNLHKKAYKDALRELEEEKRE